MNYDRISQEKINETIAFHGHWCPGLAIGIRASEWALQEMGASTDEEIVAVVETDMCGVDAIQYLTGCTFGKGNLIYRDVGKNAFTFFRRSDNKGIRLMLRPSVYGEGSALLGKLHQKMQSQGLTEEEMKLWDETRQDASNRVMKAELENVFERKEPEGPPPQKARILSSITCDACAEDVMESRTRRLAGETLCIPCFDKKERR